MTAPAPHRTHLPLLTPRSHPGGRSPMTCHYRCDDACSKPVPNRSDNSYFGDLVADVSRRRVLQSGGLAAAAVGLTAVVGASPAAAHGRPSRHGGRGGRSPLGFEPIDPQPASLDRVVVPRGHRWQPLISWGDPITASAPDFDFDRQSARAQEGQFGYNCDFTALLPGRHRDRATLVCNNEYTNDELMFRGFTDYASLSEEQLRIAMAAHGMSVVEVRRRSPRHAWRYVRGARRNRRITATTPMELTGPAAGSRLVRTSADPRGRTVLGTFANCSGGVTPWGTVLSGEENWNGYFSAPEAPEDQQDAYDRYGITGSTGRAWEKVDPRFDLTREPNEVNRFGWIVEVDPTDPRSTPRKHTALGRTKHEAATTAVADDGRVVVYLGDDERFDYLYKFVSAKKMWRGNSERARRHNLTLLESGDLYVAKFTGDGAEDGVSDGTGEWLPLVVDGTSYVPGFSVDEVLVWTRLAADAVGPTKMDRPEDVETNPRNGRVYMACTNNSQRVPSQIDEANPRANNKHGHIIEISPAHDDHGHGAFTWQIVLIAGDPDDPTTYFAGYDKSQVSPISCPDNVAFDRDGNLWIATDGNALGHCDGLFAMPLAGRERGHLQQFLSVPHGAECCGPVVTEDERTVLAAIQHPGEVDGASPESPQSQFPYQGDGQPRPGVIQVLRPHGRHHR